MPKEKKVKLKPIKKISSEEYQELMMFVDNKVLGDFKYPYPLGLTYYRDEVCQSIRLVTGRDTYFKPRLEPIITIEFLPYFVVKWLQEHNFKID